MPPARSTPDDEPVTVAMSRQAATFLLGAVRDLNHATLLPPGSLEALQTSAWLEEIEATVAAALDAGAPPR